MRRNSFVLFESPSETKSIEGITTDYMDKLRALRLKYVEIKYAEGINVCWKLFHAFLKLGKIQTNADLEILDSSFTEITKGVNEIILSTLKALHSNYLDEVKIQLAHAKEKDCIQTENPGDIEPTDPSPRT